MDRAKLSYEEERKRILEKLVEVKEKQSISTTAIEHNTSKEDLWKNEYRDFEKNKVFYKFHQVITSIYNKYGRIYEENRERIIDIDLIANVHALDLIDFEDENRSRIVLTPKGKFFIQMYLKEHGMPNEPDLPF
jgi:hypothetical protein